MGDIYYRTNEHLGTTDSMVIITRRKLINAAKAFRDQGALPVNVDHPETFRMFSGGAIVPYRNPLALFGYYCVFLGFIVAIGAMTAVAYYFSRTYLDVKDIRFGKTVVFIGFIVGMILELAAFLLGILGLLYVRTHPTARGTGHAALSIILGPILLIAQLVALILLLAWIDGKFQP